ncbi:hepcidin-like [Scomber scombrus]|uniref:hepcidin-like n=1 Tax=Scomber scombrus TaxID=13677 RepID=UPI002DDB20CB|nr:hepcidin-like [Scomber scombrus]
MKKLSIAIAVAIALTFICIQESSAVPFDGVEEQEENSRKQFPMNFIDSWKMPYKRNKRRSSPTDCRFCCHCSRQTLHAECGAPDY